MSIRKLISLVSLISLGAIASSQTLPPPNFAGQSYWFGPGPSAMSLQSSSQNSGGWIEFTNDGSTWAVAGNGGPAYFSSFADNSMATAVFNVTTTMTIQQYIYVDGYFGLTASISGFGGGPVNLGSSRFYVIHNVPIQVVGFSLGNLIGPGSTSLNTTYDVTATSYTQPTVTDSFSFTGGASGTLSLDMDPITDEGISYVDIQRTVTVPAGAPGGSYSASGSIQVTTI